MKLSFIIKYGIGWIYVLGYITHRGLDIFCFMFQDLGLIFLLQIICCKFFWCDMYLVLYLRQAFVEHWEFKHEYEKNHKNKSLIPRIISSYSIYIFYILSGCIGKVVASHAAVARSSPAEVALIHTMHVALRGYCPWGWRVRPVSWIYRLWRHCP